MRILAEEVENGYTVEVIKFSEKNDVYVFLTPEEVGNKVTEMLQGNPDNPEVD